MPIHSAQFSTRPVSLVLLAAFAGAAIWLFQPWSFAFSSGGAGPSDGSALPSSLKVDGHVQVQSEDGIVRQLVVPIALRGEGPISLDGAVLRAETEMSPTAAAAVPATFTVRWLDGNGDNVLDPGEHAELTVALPDHTSVHPLNRLDLVFKTADGGTLSIQNVLP
ncbi:MAG TPA: hypothetical protein VFX74_00995 [Candidatus Limnocylindria bacterium]|nr:hypothetical protein [Candidatus Limnocylindria bacterium]